MKQTRKCERCNGAGSIELYMYRGHGERDTHKEQCPACSGLGEVEAIDRGQTEGQHGLLITHSAISGTRSEPIRKWVISEVVPSSHYRATVEVSIRTLAPRKRTWESRTAYGNETYYTVEVDGETVYDSRTDVPVDMERWNATWTKFGRR